MYSADEIALRFHHRLIFIHPFANGNGRHARLATDVLALKLRQPAFPWGANTGQPAAIREVYLGALRSADQHDYGPLLHFARTGKI